MGCLICNSRRIGGMSVQVSYSPIFADMVECLDTFDVDTRKVNEMNVLCQRKGGLSFSCGLVCSTTDVKRLRLNPNHIWLMPGNFFSDNVIVISNVEWHVLN